jgi:hypothetical protein
LAVLSKAAPKAKPVPTVRMEPGINKTWGTEKN